MSHKINVFRTHVEIHDYNMGDCPRLERNFSVFDPLTHKIHFKAMDYNPDTRTLYLPRGIDISFLEMLLQTEAYIDMGVDRAIPTRPIMLKNLPRDRVQQEAVQFMVSQGKYHNNRNYTMLSLNLPTGKGKTYCSVCSISFMRYKSIIITSSLSVLEQWKKFIVLYTDIQPEEVCIITGSPAFMKLLKNGGNEYAVFLCSHATIQTVATSNGWDTIHELFISLGIGLKFYDEAHLDFDNMFKIDCHTNTLLSYYITASPGRSNASENAIFKLYFKNVPSINLFDEENDPHTEYVAIKYNSRPDPIEVENCMGAYGLDRNAYTRYVVEKENFYNLLHILIHMVKQRPGKALWYIGTNRSIVWVRDWIYANYPDLIGLVGIFTTIATQNKEKQLEKKIILSTTKSAGAAIDIRDLSMTVVLAEPFKSKIIAQQTFGRTRGDNTLYVDIVDCGFATLRKHYREKMPVFNKFATKCSEITIREKELSERVQRIKDENDSFINPMEFRDPDMVTCDFTEEPKNLNKKKRKFKPRKYYGKQ